MEEVVFNEDDEIKKKVRDINTFGSDEPIKSRSHDLLNRDSFANDIAHRILANNSSTPMTIAIHGAWGSGKSTMLNLIEKYLIENGDKNSIESPIIVHFNPWLYGTVEELIKELFSEISIGIGKSDRTETAAKIADSIILLGDLISVFHSGIGEKIGILGKLFKKTPRKEKSLKQLKKELDSDLSRLKRRIIVIIDDIDRLEVENVKLLFRMLRLNLDLPYFTIILAYDQRIIEIALSNGINNSVQVDSENYGTRYLEKFVQVSIRVPEPDEDTFKIIILETLSVICRENNIDMPQDDRLEIFVEEIRSHLFTIRDIKRFMNSLMFSLQPLIDEVDLLDFIGIEIIRLKHPRIYEIISKSKKGLIASSGIDIEIEKKTKFQETWFKDFANQIPDNYRDRIISILKTMFPKLKSMQGSSTEFSDTDFNIWRRDLRICSPDIFERYFLFNVPSVDISKQQLSDFISNLNDIEKTINTLKSMTKMKVISLLEIIDEKISTIQKEKIVVLVNAIFNVSAYLRSKHIFPNDFGLNGFLHGILISCLIYIESKKERFQLLLKMIDNSDIFSITNMLYNIKPENNRQSDLLTKQDWEQLRDNTLRKIEISCENGDILNVHNLPFVLYRWKEWSSIDNVRSAVLTIIKKDEDLIKFVTNFKKVSRESTSFDDEGKIVYHIDNEEIGHFLNLDSTIERLEKLKIISTGQTAQINVKVKNLLDLIRKNDYE